MSYETNFSGSHVSYKVRKKAFSENASECPISFIIHTVQLFLTEQTLPIFFPERIKGPVIPYTIFSINYTHSFRKDNISCLADHKAKIRSSGIKPFVSNQHATFRLFITAPNHRKNLFSLRHEYRVNRGLKRRYQRDMKKLP